MRASVYELTLALDTLVQQKRLLVGVDGLLHSQQVLPQNDPFILAKANANLSFSLIPIIY